MRRAYRTSGRVANVGNKARLGALLKQFIVGWNFDEIDERAFVNDIGDKAFGETGYSAAQYYNNKTYVVYQGDGDNPFIIVYDHSSDLWSSPVKIGDSDLIDADDHGKPSLLIDSSGYIHVMWDGHGTAIKYSISTNTEDITAWTSQTSPITGTYPQLFELSNGDIYVFYRAVLAGTQWGYKKSTDGGVTWGSYVYVYTDYAYCVFRQLGDIFHVTMYGHNTAAATRLNVYYSYFDLTNIYNIDDTQFSLPIDLTQKDDFIVYESSEYYTPKSNIAVSPTGKVFIVFRKTVNALDLSSIELMYAEHDGTDWNISQVGIRGTMDTLYSVDIDAVSNEEVLVYCNIGGSFESGKTTMYEIKTTDNGNSWLRTKIFDDYVRYPAIPRNYNSDIRVVFSTYLGMYTHFRNSAYAWGDNGFIGNVQSRVSSGINNKFYGLSKDSFVLSPSNYGMAYYFDGSNNLIVPPNSITSFNNGVNDLAFSIIFSFRVDATVAKQTVIEKLNYGDKEYELIIEGGELSFSCLSPDSAKYIRKTVTLDETQTLTNFCITYDGSKLASGIKIYREAVELIGTESDTGDYDGMTATDGFLTIGSHYSGTNYFTGEIDYMGIYKGVLGVSTQRRIIQNGLYQPSQSYLLDDYQTAFAAYSIRRLSSTYSGNCMIVRRNSDDEELSIGFRGDLLDANAIINFIGLSGGYVTKWFDQSGNGRDVSVSSANYQPVIVSGGNLVKINTLPVVGLQASSDQRLEYTDEVITKSNIVAISVYKQNGEQSYYRPFGIRGLSSTGKETLGPAADNTVRYDGAYSAGSVATSLNPLIRLTEKTNSSIKDYINDELNIDSSITLPDTNGYISVGSPIYGNSSNFYGNIAECIMFETDMTTGLEIREKVNEFYNLY